MAHKLENLDGETRRWMLEELRYDLDHDSLYVSSLLSERGRREYATILKEALGHLRSPVAGLKPGSQATDFDLTQSSRHASTRLTAARRTAEKIRPIPGWRRFQWIRPRPWPRANSTASTPEAMPTAMAEGGRT